MRRVRGLVQLVVFGAFSAFVLSASAQYTVQVPPSLSALMAVDSLDDVLTPIGAPVGPGAAPGPVSAAPVGPAPAFPADPSDFTFMAGSASDPVRFDPCTPIHYLVNPDRGGPGALEDTHAAFARLSAVTGLEFVFDGTTDTVPTSSWGRRAGRPVLVGWTDPASSDLLSPGASANGGGDRIGGEYVTGSVVLNADHVDLYAPGFGPGQTRGNLLLHELAHVVGLGHAASPGQVMFGTISSSSPDGYSAGDLAGLARLGRSAGCL